MVIMKFLFVLGAYQGINLPSMGKQITRNSVSNSLIGTHIEPQENFN